MTDHVLLNRKNWDEDSPNWVERGRDDWASNDPVWGIWHVPESQLEMLTDVGGRDAVELGCGTFPLIHADAEHVPLASAAFDFAISEYGAAIWCDPYRWIPEAARLLRPGGRLVFMTNGVLLMLTTPDLEVDGPARECFLRDYFGMHRFEWTDYPSVEFHLPHGELIRLLRSSGFEVEDLIEVRPPEGATTRHQLATVEWARRWPSEEVWKVRRR